MAELKLPTKPAPNWEQVRDNWVRAVENLVADVELWCKANDWPTRRIDKHLTESPVGEYVVPALLIQVDLVKLMLEPVARFVPRADGVVDLYEMPQYDDVASIFLRNGVWQIHYPDTGDAFLEDAGGDEATDGAATVIRPFTAAEFSGVVNRMV